jgi:hypothetical protein
MIVFLLILSPALAFWGRSASGLPFLESNFAAEAFDKHLSTCGIGEKSEWIEQANALCEAALLLFEKAERPKDAVSMRDFMKNLDNVWEDKGPENVVKQQRAEAVSAALDKVFLPSKAFSVESCTKIYPEMEKQFLNGEWKQFIVLGKETGDFSQKEWNEACSDYERPAIVEVWEKQFQEFNSAMEMAGMPEGKSFEEAYAKIDQHTLESTHSLQVERKTLVAAWKKREEANAKKAAQKAAQEVIMAPIKHRRARNLRRIKLIILAGIATFHQPLPADGNGARQLMGAIFLPRTWLHFYEQSGLCTWANVAIPLIIDLTTLLWNVLVLWCFFWKPRNDLEWFFSFFFESLLALFGSKLALLAVFYIMEMLLDTETGLVVAYLLVGTKLIVQSFFIFKMCRSIFGHSKQA